MTEDDKKLLEENIREVAEGFRDAAEDVRAKMNLVASDLEGNTAEFLDENEERDIMDDNSEPIDSIEKTVADLKKKVQEISAEAKKEAEKAAENTADELKEGAEAVKEHAEDAKEAAAEIKEDIKEDIKDAVDDDVDRGLEVPGFVSTDSFEDEKEDLIDTALDAVDDSIDVLKKKTEELRSNVRNRAETMAEDAKDKTSEFTRNMKAKLDDVDVAKTVDFIKANAVKAVDVARAKFEELKANESVQRTLSGVNDKAKDITESVKKSYESNVPEEKRQEISRTLNRAAETIQDSTKNLNEAVNDFMEKPDVQDALIKVKTTALDLAEKVTESLQKLLGQKDDE